MTFWVDWWRPGRRWVHSADSPPGVEPGWPVQRWDAVPRGSPPLSFLELPSHLRSRMIYRAGSTEERCTELRKVEDMKPGIIFRRATEADHPRLVAIAKQHPCTKDFSNRMMFSSPSAYEKGWIRVAQDEATGEVLGFTCVRVKKRVQETVLYYIAVDRAARRRGLGHFLLADLAEHNLPSGSLSLNCAKTNGDAMAFYERHGFKVEGESLKGAGWALRREFVR